MNRKKKKGYIFDFKHAVLFFIAVSQICFSQNPAKKLKILFVTSKFPYATRPYTDNQIVSLLDKGHEVYILAQNPGKYADYPLIKQYNLLERTYYFEQIESEVKMPEALKNTDIIYCQFGGWLAEYCLRLIDEKGMDVRLIVCLRGADATGNLINNPHQYNDLFVKVDLFMPVCEYFKNNIIKYGCDPGKIVVHHSAIDCTKFKYKARKKPKKGNVRFVVVATLSERKGIRYILYAIDRLRKKYPNIKLIIVGGGGKYNQIKNLVEKLHLEKCVNLLGFQLHSQVVTELNRAHIFLLAPYTGDNGIQEGIPNSLMEAMATGLPAVSTYNGGIPELVKDDISGFLVPEKSVDMLVKKMAYLIEHPECWGPMGKAGSKQVNKEHNRNKATNRLIDIFFSVLKRGKG